ncbi:MAG: hypothetical protein INQ03_08285 [Candidatus Heimdallarchaeota archaeon]|nr:hypothetical protein [Candidatus Heimdallarchaeota archaeon]
MRCREFTIEELSNTLTLSKDPIKVEIEELSNTLTLEKDLMKVEIEERKYDGGLLTPAKIRYHIQIEITNSALEILSDRVFSVRYNGGFYDIQEFLPNNQRVKLDRKDKDLVFLYSYIGQIDQMAIWRIFQDTKELLCTRGKMTIPLKPMKNLGELSTFLHYLELDVPIFISEKRENYPGIDIYLTKEMEYQNKIQKPGFASRYTKYGEISVIDDLVIIQSEILRISIPSAFEHNVGITVEFLGLELPVFTLRRQTRTERFKNRKKLDIYGFNHKYFIETDELTETLLILTSYNASILDQILDLFKNTGIRSTGSSLLVQSEGKIRTYLLPQGYILYRIRDKMTFFEKRAIQTITNEIGAYLCSQCCREIPLIGKTCIHCGHLSPICIICYINPEPDEQISQLVCCNSYAHTSHIKYWLKTRETCPYCGSHNPKIRDIRELKT